jgi:hypothetical protein
MTDPFEDVTPATPLDPWQVLTTELSRSMMWDMIGPEIMRNNPTKYGQNPASDDVLEAEASEMWSRKQSILPFGLDFPFLCYVAAEIASLALIKSDEVLTRMSDDEKMRFRVHNIKLSTAVAESVVSHMLQKGLINYGDRNEFLGKQVKW